MFFLNFGFVRKRLIEGGVITEEDEIKFMNFLFTRHKKSHEAWSHRYVNKLFVIINEQKRSFESFIF
jgi:hypothetical protein